MDLHVLSPNSGKVDGGGSGHTYGTLGRVDGFG